MNHALKLKKINEDVYWGLTKQEFYLIIQKIVGIVTINDEYYEQTGYLHRASYEEGTELLKVILKQQALRERKAPNCPIGTPEKQSIYAGFRRQTLHHKDIRRKDFQQWVGIMRRSKEMIESLKIV